VEPFRDKLAYVMKALSISRGRLSSDLGLDKSVVSRWLSGTRMPSANNLAALTGLIGGHAPGFTMHDWDLPLGGLGARLGVAGAAKPGEAPRTQVLPQNFQEWLALPKVADAAAASGEAARAAAGFWRSTAPRGGQPEQYSLSFSMLSANPDGTLRVESGFFTMRSLGWAVPVGHQFFGCLTGIDGYFAFSIFNRSPLPILDVMDGILLACRADNAGMPIAIPLVMERIEDLSGDPGRDALRLTELLATNPLVSAADVAEPVRRRLMSNVEENRAASTPSPFLTMPALTSLARGRYSQDGDDEAGQAGPSA
jgi:transcriptional regulator with XRE-family HTH domain